MVTSKLHSGFSVPWYDSPWSSLIPANQTTLMLFINGCMLYSRKKSAFFSCVTSFSGLLGDHLSDSEAECCDVRWDSKMDNPSGGTLKRTASSCQPEGASVTSAATPRLCSGRLKICLLALVLLHTVIIISASHNSTLVGVAAIFSPEESASNEEWTLGLNLVLVKSDVAREDYGFYSVMAARDTSGETCGKCLYNLPQMNHQPQEVGGF